MTDDIRRDPPGPQLSAARSPDLHRRRLLMFGAGAAGAAAAAPVLCAPASLVEAAPAQPSTGSGYRETEHVRNYYATTRI